MLILLCEQGAVPLDQLGRFLGDSLSEAVALTQGLEEAGCVEHERFLAGDYPWLWPSRRGVELGRPGGGHFRPDVTSLTHRRAVNEIRLHLAELAPRGRWICERDVMRVRDPEDHLPDGVFVIDGERHAIEAELSRKSWTRLRQIVAQHSNRYDAVIYFCGRRTHTQLRAVLGEGRWPKLVVRALPGGLEC